MSKPEEVLVLDAGNSIIKAKTNHAELAYPHAMRELTEQDYQSVISRAGFSGPPEDYMVINGKPYVFGKSAERFGPHNRRNGAARYDPHYYGIFMAATLARLYDEASEIALFGSHAPKDVAFRERLMRAAIGKWVVDMGGVQKVFKVSYANTFDEPVGGLMNVLLTEDGLHYQRNDVRDGDTLVIDVGGFTTDWLAVRPGGEVDYSLHESVTIGIQNVIRDFERSFRANNLDATQATPDLPPARVREAIVTGVYRGGGREYPCQREVDEATNILLSQIADTYQNVARGPIPWDTIILTGGGSALLYKRLLPILNHKRILLSEKKPNENHLANVRGGMKLWKLYKEHNLL